MVETVRLLGSVRNVTTQFKHIGGFSYIVETVRLLGSVQKVMTVEILIAGFSLDK